MFVEACVVGDLQSVIVTVTRDLRMKPMEILGLSGAANVSLLHPTLNKAYSCMSL